MSNQFCHWAKETKIGGVKGGLKRLGEKKRERDRHIVERNRKDESCVPLILQTILKSHLSPDPD